MRLSVARLLYGILFGIAMGIFVLAACEGLLRLVMPHKDLSSRTLRLTYDIDNVKDNKTIYGKTIEPSAAIQDYFVPSPEDSIAFSQLDYSGKFGSEDVFTSELPATFRPSIQFNSRVRTRSGKLIYDALISIDEFGRRKTLNPKKNQADQFIMFLGCSVTFGEGLSDDETLPSQVAQKITGFQVYNYAVGGDGPNAQLKRLLGRDLSHEIAEKEGEAFYVFGLFHMPRLLGTMTAVSTYWEHHPYYFLDEKGELQGGESFKKGRAFFTYLYQILGKSQIVRYLGIEIPLGGISASDVDLLISLFKNMERKIRDQKQLKKFTVIILPQTENSELLTMAFERSGIHYVNYGTLDFQKHLKFPANFPGDNHPTRYFHDFFSSNLVSDLSLRSN